MNADDFERRLQRQPVRRIPGEWRAEILGAALARRSDQEKPGTIPAGWRLWFARVPAAWGALATLWVVLLGVNQLVFRSGSAPVSRTAFTGRIEPLAVWSLQHSALSQLDDRPPTAAESPEAVPLRPRSERRRSQGLAESWADPSSGFLV